MPFQRAPVAIPKCNTGITGFDEISGGGLPLGRATLIVGGSGSGKSVFALQTLVNGARFYDEPGIFVAFEEDSRQIRGNAATFGWDLQALEEEKLFFLDAHISPAIVQTGDFDLEGLLNSIAAKARAMNARRVVFDSVDVLLYLLRDDVAEREEIYRIREWLATNDLTGIITVKDTLVDTAQGSKYGFVPYMADMVIHLEHELIERVAVRNLRILKYRGSSFADNKFPLVFGAVGIEIGGLGYEDAVVSASAERISSGIPRLDTMLDGGYFKGSGILISGSPGTAKSTLAGAMVQACCQRGERAVYFCFDEWGEEVVRNLTSVNIHLAPYVQQGLLQMVTAHTETRNAEEHLLRIRSYLDDPRVTLLVIDPISAMVKAGGDDMALIAVQRLIRLTKSRGITLFITSLLSTLQTQIEGTPIQISTIADTWIHISYVIQGGERNRALTVVKSRGSRHSNQERELLLSDEGITLTDVYTAQGQVLMGTARWQKEEEERRELAQAELQLDRRLRQLSIAQTETRSRLEVLKRELEAQNLEAQVLESERGAHRTMQHELREHLHDLRSGDEW